MAKYSKLMIEMGKLMAKYSKPMVEMGMLMAKDLLVLD